MFRKFFDNLTQSSENKRRARFLESLEAFAETPSIKQTDHLSDLVGLLAMAKQGFDQAKSLHAFGEKQSIDFDPLGEAVCEESKKIMVQLAELYEQLPTVFIKADPAALKSHLDKQQACFSRLQSACAALQRCSASDADQQMMDLSEACDTTTPLGETIENLLLQVRTFERISALGR